MQIQLLILLYLSMGLYIYIYTHTPKFVINVKNTFTFFFGGEECDLQEKLELCL